MNIQIKKYVDPIKNFWVNLPKKKKIISISVLGGIVLLSVIAGVLINTQPYVVLYPGMEHGEAVEVMNGLRDRDVSFKEENGTIYVPKDKENALRMEFANEGHPRTAPNYDFFTKNVDIMSTDFEKKTIEKYQLNQRLEAVIKTLNGIQNANVTISIPDSSGYAWDENAEATTASVTVTLASGKTLEASQVNGIKQLVSKSVPNLKAEDVAVIDTATGDELSSSQNGNQVNLSEFKLTIEKEYEKDIEKNILKVLNPIFGENNVKVTAKSIMDVDKKVQEIITYKPSTEGGDRGIISESNVHNEQEAGGKKTGGAAGTESNTETTYPGVTVNGDVIYTKDDQSYKYLVSQVKEQVQADAASVQDMTISIVVNQKLMDDTQKQDIAKLAAYAAAINPEKVAVYNSTFPGTATQPTGGPITAAPSLKTILILGGAALLTLLIVLLIVVIIARKRRKKKMLELAALEGMENPEDETSLKSRLEGESDGLEAKKAIELKAIEDARAEKASQEEALTKEIQEFSSQNPEIAAQLIRSWLRGDDTDG